MLGSALLAQSLAAARRPEFRYLWLANSVSNFARWFELAVLTWLALTMTGSSWQLAVIGFWRNIPLLPLGAFGGVLADLFDRRRLVIITQLASAAVTLGIALLLLTGQLTYGHLVGSSLILGLIAAVDWPCRRALIMDVVARQEVVNAAALDTATTMGSRIFGPLFGGALIAWLGVAGCYVVLTLANAAAGLAALGLRPVPPLGRASVQRVAEDLAEGVRYVYRRPNIYTALAVSFLANLLVLPFLQFLPVFARDVLYLDPVRYGTLGASVGLGAVASAVVLAAQARRWRPEAMFPVGAAMIGLGLLPFALTSSYPVALVGLFVVGGGQGIYAALQAPVILLRADAALRGRLMGLLVLVIGIWPVGMLLMGVLIDGFGAPLAVASVSAAFLVVLGALAAGRPELHRSAARPAATQRAASEAVGKKAEK